MCGFDFVETNVSDQSSVTPKAPFEISFDDARQGDPSQNTLYVLGFGLAGAILGNALVLVFLSWP
jgi:hypothetical protein